MVTNKEIEFLLSKCLTTGATNSDIYIENKFEKYYILENQKLENITIKKSEGVGIRIYDENHQVFASTSDITKESIEKKIEQLLPSFSVTNEVKKVTCIKKENSNLQIPKIKHSDYSEVQKKNLLLEIDKISRNFSPLVQQVRISLIEVENEVKIANSNGTMTTYYPYLTRLVIGVTTKKNDRLENMVATKGIGGGYEFLDCINLQEFVEDITRRAIVKLDAVDAPSGELPVIIGPGFGAVIFHEACGHALEATSIAKKESVFYDQKDKIVASKKVTLIDDGTIINEWGSISVDDEGNIPQKNILIEEGLLKNFLIDEYNSKKMKVSSNGCARRESYQFAPTSRMTNTYLASGVDKIEDMVASISYGVYCKTFTGGSVNTTTGEFNFTVSEAFLIEDGKMTSPLKNISLIGKGHEVLKKVEMVSDDLSLATGYCGSASGTIPVTIGQPTIKVSSILIGGTK